MRELVLLPVFGLHTSFMSSCLVSTAMHVMRAPSSSDPMLGLASSSPGGRLGEARHRKLYGRRWDEPIVPSMISLKMLLSRPILRSTICLGLGLHRRHPMLGLFGLLHARCAVCEGMRRSIPELGSSACSLSLGSSSSSCPSVVAMLDIRKGSKLGSVLGFIPGHLERGLHVRPAHGQGELGGEEIDVVFHVWPSWSRPVGVLSSASASSCSAMYQDRMELGIEVVADDSDQSVVMGGRCASMFGLELLMRPAAVVLS
ncbi:hypothetical protein Dimus_026288 [Dionaea muscipula]